MDPLTLAQRAAAGDLDPEAARWLAIGFQRFLAGGEPLELALGLRDSARMQTRNRHLLEAAMLLADGRDLSPWALAGELSKAIRRFEANRGAQRCPVDDHLAAAAATGARPIRSRGRLLRLLTL